MVVFLTLGQLLIAAGTLVFLLLYTLALILWIRASRARGEPFGVDHIALSLCLGLAGSAGFFALLCLAVESA